MRVVMAETAGFCKGVRNALDVTLETVRNGRDGTGICTFGPLIHNRQVMAMLEERGVREAGDIESCAGKRVVIRAHGIPPSQRQALHAVGAEILDATCQRVAKVQAVIKAHTRKGFRTVIVGDADHAEVIGLMGYTEGEGCVITGPEEVDDLPRHWEKVLLVAQTTQNEEVFREIQERFLRRYPQAIVKNTICHSTHQRQAEVRTLCEQVEAMVIVGGTHSGNTLRLAEIARECRIPTYHVETEAGLEPREMARYRVVGVSAGASTPNWIIQNVVTFLESVKPERAGGRLARAALDLVAYSNVTAAVGAAFLTAAVEALTALPTSFGKAAMAASYVFAMHTLNHYVDRRAMQLNDPRRAAFYERWHLPVAGAGVAAALLALALAASHGWIMFLAMLGCVALGVLYGVPLFRPAWRQSLAALRIKNIPASKTLLIPTAWAVVTAFLPNIGAFFAHPGAILFAGWAVFLIVFARTALLDLLDVRGDRIVGRETVVVFFGEKWAAWVAGAALGLLGLSGVLAPFLGLSTGFSVFLAAPALAYGWFLRECLANRMKGGPSSESLIDSVLVATGLAGLLWKMVAG